MNGNNHLDHRCDEEKHIDLLPHRYRPESVKKFTCHLEQASKLKQCIQEFIDLSKGVISGSQYSSDYDDSSCSSEASANLKVIKKCVLLTGPPGVGKTSLVYTIANELKLHVIESHGSEKRDFKLFSMLKLTNQKGKINPIAKLFQAAKINQQTTRRKRRKLTESNEPNQPRVLSLSGTISIILFDDIDVLFEEDGPFLKSLVEFIKESKRPVILTATQSIDSIKEQIKEVLIYCEHIDLPKPSVEDCAKLLKDICKSEGYGKLSRISRCRALANLYDCDIRQCLNRIHLFGDKADQEVDVGVDSDCIRPELSRLNLENSEVNTNKTILQCYTNASLVDLMTARYHSFTRSTLLENWLDGKPSYCSDEYDYDRELGEQIRQSIIDLNRKLYTDQMMTDENLIIDRKHFTEIRNELVTTTSKINSKINCRIEPPEKEFFSEIVPMFGTLASLDADKRVSSSANGGSSRRSRRTLSYLDDIKVYFEPKEIEKLGDFATMRSAQEAIIVRENARVPEQK